MLYWLLIITALVAIIFVSAYYKKRSVAKKKLTGIRDKWGKPVYEKRNFDLISIYLETEDRKGKISPSTAEDLDLKHVFDYIDRTNSRPGQQYLYNTLHDPQTSVAALHEMDNKIAELGSDRAKQERIEAELSKLDAINAYYLPELFAKEQLPLFSPQLTFYIQVSGIIVITLAILLSLQANQFFFIVLLLLLVTNLVIHYKNKGKLPSIPILYLNWLF